MKKMIKCNKLMIALVIIVSLFAHINTNAQGLQKAAETLNTFSPNFNSKSEIIAWSEKELGYSVMDTDTISLIAEETKTQVVHPQIADTDVSRAASSAQIKKPVADLASLTGADYVEAMSAIFVDAQDWETKLLKWNTDSLVAAPDFENTDQIIAWGKNEGAFPQVKSERIDLKDADIFILTVDICSGVYCPHIYLFMQVNQHWKLIKAPTARLSAQIDIKVDEQSEKIIFSTTSSQIGELSFRELNAKF